MNRTPAPEEVAVLNEIVSAYCPMSQHMAKKHEQALAILDRLSPPAPEVDEVTKIWREMMAVGPYNDLSEFFRDGRGDQPERIAYLRQVLSELIASKDAEIERYRKAHDLAETCYHLEVPVLTRELAALRAENERLRNFCTLEQCEEAAERNTAEPEKPCTCHPDDNPPRPCPRKYALAECRAAAADTAPVIEVTQK